MSPRPLLRCPWTLAAPLLVGLAACSGAPEPAAPPPGPAAPPPRPAPPPPPQAAVAPPPRACPSDPVALVTVAYTPYLGDGLPPALLEATCWSADTRRLIEVARARADAEGGVPAPGFDPLVNAQDYELTGLEVSAIDADTVEARFANFGVAQVVRWDLVDEGGWRVHDLNGEGWGLRAALAR